MFYLKWVIAIPATIAKKNLSALSEYHNFSCHLVLSSHEVGSKKTKSKVRVLH